MSENVYERIHRVLTWKRIIAFNVVLFLVLVVPISVRLTQQDTENRSSAADPLPSVTPPPSYPSQPPKIDRVSQFFGKSGDTIVVLGANFGAYQWGSKVYVGNVEAPTDAIVRWSNNILEVRIPETARTGRVWVVINGQQSQWEGSLLLTDVARSAQIGFRKENQNTATVWIGNANGVTRGMIELSHVGEPTTAVFIAEGTIISQSENADSLGKKLKVEFEFSTPLTSIAANVLQIQHPGIGSLEIVRVELYDSQNKLVSVYADPFNVKVQ